MMIDLIGQGQPDDVTAGSWAIELLKDRFAENDFWDAAGWRAWWAEYTRSP